MSPNMNRHPFKPQFTPLLFSHMNCKTKPLVEKPLDLPSLNIQKGRNSPKTTTHKAETAYRPKHKLEDKKSLLDNLINEEKQLLQMKMNSHIRYDLHKTE